MSSCGIDLDKLRGVVKQGTISAETQGREQASKLLRNILMGAAAGVPISYLLFNSATGDDRKPYQFSSTLDVPAAKKHYAEKQKSVKGMPKLAGSWLGSPSSPDGHWVTQALGYTAFPASLLGLGYITKDILEDSYRRKEQKKVDQAKKEYEKTLIELYKESSADDVELEKVANIGHNLLGAYIPAALVLAGLGYTAVDSAYKSNRDIVDKAIEERRRRSFRQQPTGMQAVTSNIEESEDAAK